MEDRGKGFSFFATLTLRGFKMVVNKPIPTEEWFAEAVKYFSAALHLVRIDDVQERKICTPPIYLLTIHGVELTLKAGLLESGCSFSDVRKMSHDIERLWEDKNNLNIKDLAVKESLKIDNSRGKNTLTGAIPDVNIKTFDTLNKAIVDIGRLHKDNGSSFKYPRPGNASCITPYVLIDVFYPIALNEMKRIVKSHGYTAPPVVTPPLP